MGHKSLPLLTALAVLAILVFLTTDRRSFPITQAKETLRPPIPKPPAPPAKPHDPRWGGLRGRFVVEGETPPPQKLDINKDKDCCGQHDLYDESLIVGPRGELANVLLLVRSKDMNVHADYADTSKDAVRLEIKNCRFDPHLLAVRVTQTLEIRNLDPLGHSANLNPPGDAPIGQILTAGDSAHTFKKTQKVPTPLVCNIHPWMKAYVMIHDNPYAVVTNLDGEFQMTNLPTGKLEFLCWHEKAGYLDARPDSKKGRFTLEIKPGNNDLGTITIRAEQFQREQ